MSERPPTPTGWSDTDWIKKLQHEEENPLGCLHINQGSFDAAADAYEEEYKMSKRTAMDIALDLDAAACSSFVKLEAAEALRRQHAEIERLKSDAERVNTYAKNLAISTHRKHFSHITQWEPLPDTIGLLTQIDNMSCWTGDDVAQLTAERETIISDFLKRIGQYVTNDSIREAAIAAAVAAEREACAVVCDGLESLLPGTKTGNMLQWAAYQIRARSAT